MSKESGPAPMMGGLTNQNEDLFAISTLILRKSGRLTNSNKIENQTETLPKPVVAGVTRHTSNWTQRKQRKNALFMDSTACGFANIFALAFWAAPS